MASSTPASPTLKVHYCVAANPGTAYGSEVLADNPISYWALNETSPGGACDAQGRNHGRIYSGITPGQSNAVAGTAMSFNGSNGYVKLDGATSLQPTAALSVEGWIKTTSTDFQTVMRWRWYGYDLYLQPRRAGEVARGRLGQALGRRRRGHAGQVLGLLGGLRLGPGRRGSHHPAHE